MQSLSQELVYFLQEYTLASEYCQVVSGSLAGHTRKSVSNIEITLFCVQYRGMLSEIRYRRFIENN